MGNISVKKHNWAILEVYYKAGGITKSGGITKQFSSTTGVKQGCNLSPCMSNLYQNDLHNIFDETCDPTCLGTLKINSLSWADDLVIVSKSALGLQNCLNKLYLYCLKWGLNLNTQKTKCIEF